MLKSRQEDIHGEATHGITASATNKHKIDAFSPEVCLGHIEEHSYHRLSKGLVIHIIRDLPALK